MKSPLWIVTSMLVLFFVAMLIFIMVSMRSLLESPLLSPIKVSPKPEMPSFEAPKPKDLSVIYEDRDLFGTTQPITIAPKQVVPLPTIPPPPTPKPVKEEPAPASEFLEPLPIKITGIIASSNETKSQVTVVNENTKESSSYKIGDKLFDAYILRILPKKIVILRSNGQEETLYLYQEDAEEEAKSNTDWETIIQQDGDNRYLINPATFIARITSLALLIDRLDMTTAFSENKSVGIRIGMIQDESLGSTLGFMPGDIIIEVQGIKPISTRERLALYNKVSQLEMDEQITVKFIRQGQIISHTYTLVDLEKKSTENETITTALQVHAIHAKRKEQAPSYQGPIYAMKHNDKESLERFGSKKAFIAAQTTG